MERASAVEAGLAMFDAAQSADTASCRLNVRFGSFASPSAIDGCQSTSAMPRLRPKSCGVAKCCDGPLPDMLAYSITSSAQVRSGGEMSMPSCFAVLGLITSSDHGDSRAGSSLPVSCCGPDVDCNLGVQFGRLSVSSALTRI